MVAECSVFRKRLIVKLVGEIRSIYTGMSNICSVRITTALCLRVSLLYNITKCYAALNFNKILEN